MPAKKKKTAAKKTKPKKINLALQGGGAHGAFTWGVLDKICEDGRLCVDGLSATSAGAMNAAVYSYGRMQGGFDGAREALHNFWFDISESGRQFSPIQPTWMEQWFGDWGAMDQNISYMAFEHFTKAFSPYEFNPMNFNPLRDVLQRHVDFEKITACQNTQMFICATNVRTNKIKVFRNEEVTCDAVLASACLPMLFQAVEIDGEAYWDGGYMGNPALYPLIYHTSTEDLMIVHINPVYREEVPKTSRDILNRVNEISFNSSLLREMRTVNFVKRMVDDNWIKDEHKHHFQFDNLYIHSIRADDVTKHFSLASKFSPNWEFLCHLRDAGREVMAEWIDAHIDQVGKKSTFDLRSEFE